MARPRILLDCDPGHDDVFAIAAAARYGDLLGVTTVSGNAPLDATTRNALATLEVAGIDVPVHAGAAAPLAGEARHGAAVHGETGLAGVDLPPRTRDPAGDDAPGFLADAARAAPGVWIVATGPLTNVALALDRDPELATNVAGISIMGGGTFGNVTPAAEFNVHADPEAADAVFRCGARLVLCGLDVTLQVRAGGAFLARLRAAGTPLGDFTAALAEEYGARVHALRGGEGAPLHDPCAVLAVTHPGCFRAVTRPVAVELAGAHTRGMTVVDRRPWVQDGNCEVVVGVDAPHVLDLVAAAVAP